MSSRISQDRLVETGVHSPLTDKQPVTVGLGRQFAFGERLPGRVYSRSPTRLVGFTHFVGDRDTLYYPGQANRPVAAIFLSDGRNCGQTSGRSLRCQQTYISSYYWPAFVAEALSSFSAKRGRL